MCVCNLPCLISFLEIRVVDYVMAITGLSRDDSNDLIYNSFRSTSHSEKVNKLVWDKHKFPGSGQREIYVVTIKEATSYLQCLPHKYTQDVLDYIEKQDKIICLTIMIVKVQLGKSSIGFSFFHFNKKGINFCLSVLSVSCGELRNHGGYFDKYTGYA